MEKQIKKDRTQERVTLETFLKTRLPKVKSGENKPLFEMAEITFKDSGNRMMVYVIGYNCRRQLVHGNYITPNNRVFESGDVVIGTTLLQRIRGYRPLVEESVTIVG